VTSGALVLAALDAIGAVIWYSMLQVLPAEGGADGRRRRSVAGAGVGTLISGPWKGHCSEVFFADECPAAAVECPSRKAKGWRAHL